jgi:hypothetical protein
VKTANAIQRCILMLTRFLSSNKDTTEILLKVAFNTKGESKFIENWRK